MAKHKPRKGFSGTLELANFAGTNKTRIGDYRDRKIFEPDDFYKFGPAYFYHLENCTKAINEKIRGNNQETGSEADELKKLKIPPKAISQAKSEHYKAQKAKIEFEKMRGDLVDADDFKKSLTNEGRFLRESFDALPDRLAPVLVGMDNANEIAELIRTEHDDMLVKLFSRFLDE